MSEVVFFSCDGPACVASDQESCDSRGLMEAGWMVLELIDDEEERIAHFCSYACLAAWAEENVG